ncbi:MAG: tetratricopeptide repeat protein [Thermodesulfobacteriota bacterium]
MKIKNRISETFPFFMLVIFLILIPHFNHAQDTVAQGVVTDEEGTPLKDAKVIFEDPSRGLSFHMKTDKNGRFIKVGLPPTVYQVTVELEGYFPLQSQARIRFGFTENLQITLKKIPPRIDKDKDLDEGVNHFNDGQYDKAIESFKKVIEKFPKNYEGYYNLGLTYLKKDDLDQAIDALEKATELNPESLAAYFALGEGYFAKGDNEKATQSFSKAIELDLDNPMAFYNLGIIYYRLGENEDAIQVFDKAIELNPKFSSAYYQAALALIKMGDFERAIIYFEEFLKVEPNAPEAAQVKTMIEELKKKQKNSNKERSS